VVLKWDTDSIGCGIALVSGATVRLGFSEHVNPGKARANQGNDALLTEAVGLAAPPHEVTANLALMEHLGCSISSDALELWLTEADVLSAQALAPALWNGASNAVAIGVGAYEKKRRWPPARYREVCRQLMRLGFSIVVLGSAQDQEAARLVAEAAPDGAVINLVGRTTLRQSAAMLARCSLIIGNDSGLIHMAAAVSVPCLVISCHPRTSRITHPNSPRRFGPWKVQSAVLQPQRPTAPCTTGCAAQGPHCILSVDVDQVLDAVRDLRPGRRLVGIQRGLS
jgi:heptosyltransferase-2